MDYLAAVREFHETFGQHVAESAGMQPFEVELLRLRLIKEEYHEVVDAMSNRGIEDVAKELADLLYVVFGTAVSYGIPMDEVFREVHASNMSKVGPDGKPIYREDGKVLKGPAYFEPDIRYVLEEVARRDSAG